MSRGLGDVYKRQYYYLIKRAAERGVFPDEETSAIGKMVVIPADTSIVVGDRFNLGDLNYIVTSIIDSGMGEYQIECETAGTNGNQQLGELLPIETENELNNMESAELVEILIPGEDEEDVEHFRERYFESFNKETSVGNKTDYKQKITAIDGVGNCKVKRAWEGGYNPAAMIPNETVRSWFEQQSASTVGADIYVWLKTVYGAAVKKLLTTGGTIKVMIISSEYKVPSATLVQSVQKAIDPTNSAGEGDGVSPIGHVVNVVGVSNAVVNIEFVISYKNNYSFEVLKENIEQMVDAYFMELRQDWANNDNLVVRINQIETRILQLDGVDDVAGTLINGMSENLVLREDESPVRGDVVVH